MKGNKMIPIFLSRPNPFLEEQDLFLNALESYLHINNLENNTLMAKEYNPYESISCLDEIIKRCYGMIVLSYGQTFIEKGKSKKGAIYKENFFDSIEKKADDLWITSPFCHIEGALGLKSGLPLLVLKQNNLKIEGILKPDQHIISAPDFSLKSEKEIHNYFESRKFINTFLKWKCLVEHYYNFVNNNIY